MSVLPEDRPPAKVTPLRRVPDPPKRRSSRTTEPFAMLPTALLTEITATKGSDHQITPAAALVYWLIASKIHAADSIPAAWPSTRSLAAELGLAQRTVQQAIWVLVHHGWLEEMAEEDWLPRWRQALNNRVQSVRVYRLPRHPKKVAPTRGSQRQQKADEEALAKQQKHEERHAFYRRALAEMEATGTFPNWALGQNMNIDLAARNGTLNEASLARHLNRTWPLQKDAD